MAPTSDKISPLGDLSVPKSRCPATLFSWDNHGYEMSTFRCQLPPGHAGRHTHEWEVGEDEDDHACLTWDKDHRMVCRHHGVVEHPTRCEACLEQPVKCELHGLQTEPYCETCCSEPFVCPEHGVASLPDYTGPVPWCPLCKKGPDKHWVRQYPDPSDC